MGHVCYISCIFLFFPPVSDGLQELDDAYERYSLESDPLQRHRLQLAIQRALIRSQELGDEKIQIAGQMVRERGWLPVLLFMDKGVFPFYMNFA